MFQGTASSVGKSAITAGLCRILQQDGFSVAPFKSQNMSTITYQNTQGHTISSAQYLQAIAAGVEPIWQMNPILLRPQTDQTSEVFLAGESLGSMPARQYYDLKPTFLETVQRAYEELCSRYDAIVIEGAGSAAEINFRKGDFVNMGLAQLLQVPVILVGDIDRGGVFGSLYGTLKLLSPEDQAQVKGFIINKFRGDVSLLEPAITGFEEIMGIPCLGIMPYVALNLPEEDSLQEDKAIELSLEQSLDVLAESMRQHLNIPLMKQLMEEKWYIL